MKNCFYLLSSFVLFAAVSSAAVPDIIGQFLRKKYDAGGSSVGRLTVEGKIEETFGGCAFPLRNSDYEGVVDEFSNAFLGELVKAGWSIEDRHAFLNNAIPGRRIIYATKEGKDHEWAEFVIYFFPVEGSKLGVSYSQIIRFGSEHRFFRLSRSPA